MNDFFDNQRVIQVILNHFLHFVIIGVVAVVLAALFSSPFFIKPKFRSTARIYPVNLAVTSTESESEQMLEIINSNDIKIKMFDAFNLDKVYKISRDDPKYLTYMLGKYNSNVSVRKSDFETVEIRVLDESAERAAAMCDSIIHFYNLKVREMHSIKNWELATVARNSMKKWASERDSILDLIKGENDRINLLDFETQVREVTRGYMGALSEGSGNSPGKREIKQLYENLSSNGGEIMMLQSQFKQALTIIDSLKLVYEMNVSEAHKKITYCFIVEKPVVADKKAYPVRWIIAALTTFSALFLALLFFMVADYKRNK